MAYPGQHLYPDRYYTYEPVVVRPAIKAPLGLNRMDLYGNLHNFPVKNPRYHPDAVLDPSAWSRDMGRNRPQWDGYPYV